MPGLGRPLNGITATAPPPPTALAARESVIQPNPSSLERCTALDLATCNCDVDMVRFLLGRGAIVSEQTRHAARGLRGREYLMRRVPDQVADIINLVCA